MVQQIDGRGSLSLLPCAHSLLISLLEYNILARYIATTVRVGQISNVPIVVQKLLHLLLLHKLLLPEVLRDLRVGLCVLTFVQDTV